MQVSAMTRCELHGAEMIQDRRYTTIGVFRCPRGCEIQDPGYDETRLCGLTGCQRVLKPDPSHPYQRFCSPPHRLRDWRLRRKSEQVTEVTRMLRGEDRAPQVR